MKVFQRTKETQHLRYGEDIGLQATILTYVYTYPCSVNDHCRDDNCRHFLRNICRSFEGSDFTVFQIYNIVINSLLILQNHKGLIMDFIGIEPLKNLFGEPFIWYHDDVHYNFSNQITIYPSEETKQRMRAKGIDYRDVQRDIGIDWAKKSHVYFPRLITKNSVHGFGTYEGKDTGDYETLPSLGENECGFGMW